jgi:hypothetical protein
MSHRASSLGVLAGTLTLLAGLLAGPLALADSEEREAEFPLEFAQTKFVLGDQLPIAQPVEVVFEFVNVSDHDVTYWTKSSSLRARASFKKKTVSPGESGTIDVRVSTTVAGPFRHRLGVITDTVRQGLFIEGTVVE